MKYQPLRRSHCGQALTENLILTALIAVGSIAVVQVLSSNLRSRLAIVSEALRGKRAEFQGSEVKKDQYEIHDLGDFQDGMRDNNE